MTSCRNVISDGSAVVSHDRGESFVGVAMSAWRTRRNFGSCWLGRELRHTVDEANSFNEFTESLDCGNAVPALLCF